MICSKGLVETRTAAFATSHRSFIREFAPDRGLTAVATEYGAVVRGCEHGGSVLHPAASSSSDLTPDETARSQHRIEWPFLLRHCRADATDGPGGGVASSAIGHGYHRAKGLALPPVFACKTSANSSAPDAG